MLTASAEVARVLCQIETASMLSIISNPKLKVLKVGSFASVFNGSVSKLARGYFRRVDRCPDQKTRHGYQYYHHFILSVPILASDFIPLCHLSPWPKFLAN